MKSRQYWKHKHVLTISIEKKLGWQSEMMAVWLGRNTFEVSEEWLRNGGSSLGPINTWQTVCAPHILVASEKTDKEEFTLLIDSANIRGGK